MAQLSMFWDYLTGSVLDILVLSAAAAIVRTSPTHAYYWFELTMFAQIAAYTFARAIYNIYFHPLAKYPGPGLAAATDLWWAYAR
jgi:hypothetical protein